MVQAKLVVGAADDRFEREADQIADQVMRGFDATGGVAAGSETRIGRISRIARSAAAEPGVIGAAGGDVDASTERDISAARSGGKPLDGKIRRQMEGAMGADFSGIRVNVGAKSDDLNNRIQARAFTSGSDIFVRRQDYSPGTASGQRLLAHELAHTVQQGAAPQSADTAQRAIAHSVQRTSPGVQRLFGWGKKKDADKKPEAPKPAPGITGKGKVLNAYSGPSVRKPDSTVEAAKPAGVAAGAGALALGTTLHNADMGGGAAGLLLGPATLGDSVMGLASAYDMNKEAKAHGDKATGRLAGLKAKDLGTATGMAAINTTKAAVDVTNAATHGAQAIGSTALGVGGAALGVATGSVMVLQGAWRGGQAIMKLCRLTWGRGASMLTPEGEEWKRAVLRTEKFKLAVNGLKVALGVLGIVAGALAIVSNPVGWAIGLAGAIAGGVYAVSKIAARIKNTKDLEAAKKRIDAGDAVEDIDPLAKPVEPVLSVKGKPKAKTGTGFSEAQTSKDPKTKARKDAIDRANEMARQACGNAKIAAEMREALRHGDKALVASAVEEQSKDINFDLYHHLPAYSDKTLYDAFQILSSINITAEQALADSGQDLIHKKMSKAEAM